MEVPYVRGQSDYPPPDPTVGGGLMAQMARFYPENGIDLGDAVRVLPSDGAIPGFPDWRWIHTPGHTAGHISLLRERDRVLIAGDAVVTVRQESAWAVLTQHQALSRPPAYFTTDWQSAARSVELLAALQPSVLATGHGTPMKGREMLKKLTRLAQRFNRVMPHHGRYVREPAVTDATGVLRTPPPAYDAVGRAASLAVMGVTAATVMYSLYQRDSRREIHSAPQPKPDTPPVRPVPEPVEQPRVRVPDIPRPESVGMTADR
jgi:glyoxylase-like metal-dependent hydrolase (beta-lactamase superfamily II)